MNAKILKVLACTLLVVLTLFAVAGCTESAKNAQGTSSTSETDNPFGDSFSPTLPGDTSVENVASGLQEIPSYPPGYEC